MSDLLATMERLREAQELERLRSEVKRLRRALLEQEARSLLYWQRYNALAATNVPSSYANQLALQSQLAAQYGHRTSLLGGACGSPFG